METKTIKFNWAAILAFCMFWTYALFAAVSRVDYGTHKSAIFANTGSIFFFLGSSLVLSSIFIFFLIVYFYRKSLFEDELRYTKLDRNVLILYFLSMLVFSWTELNNEINGDHFLHSTIALSHATEATYILLKVFPSIEKLEFRTIMYGINILLLVGFCSFIYFFKQRGRLLKIILYIAGFIFFRFIIIYLSKEYQDIHPPLRLFPIWLSSSIFYPSNFSLRLPQIFGLLALMFISYQFASRYFSNTQAILFGFVVGTIPVLWHAGILVEFSIWGALCVTYLLYCLLNKAFDTQYTFNLIRVSAVVSIGILLRQSNVACIFLLIVIFVYSYCYEQKYSLKKIFIYISPLLVALPFFSKSLFKSKSLNFLAINPVGNLNGFFDQIIFSITSNIALYIIINAVLYWILCIPCILFVYKRNKIIALSIFLFFCIDYVQFYSLPVGWWGLSRYQAEYIVPFAIIGFFLFMFYYANKIYVYASGCILLIVINVFFFKNISNFNKSVDFSNDIPNLNNATKLFGSPISSEFIFPYREALETVKSLGYSKNLYIHGLVYGPMPQILANYTVEEVSSTNQIRILLKESINRFVLQHNDDDLGSAINKNQNIKIILISNWAPAHLINQLKSNGWCDWKTFYDERHKSKIIGLIRTK